MRSTHGQRPRQTVQDMKRQRAPRDLLRAEQAEKRRAERLQQSHDHAAHLRNESIASRLTTREDMIAAGLIKVS